MARVRTVHNSRVAHYCTSIYAPHHEIPVGDTYLVAAPGFRGKNTFRCTDHPFRASELATGLNANALRAMEDAEDAISSAGSAADIDAAMEDLANALQELVDDREASLEAWENGNSQLEELRDQAQEALDTVEGWNSGQEFVSELGEDDEDITDEDREAEEQEWLDELRDEASSLVQDIQL